MKRLSLIILFLFIGSVVFSKGYKVITVKKGQTIQKIAKIHLKNHRSWSKLLRYNKLRSPKDVKSGMRLKIPYSLSSERVARITYKVGKVQVFDGRRWKNAGVGTLVKKNNRVRTGKTGKATVKLDDGSKVKIGKNSEITLSKYGFSKKGRRSNVKLNKGGMLVKVNKLTRKSNFGISSITAVAGVRGTTFMVRLDEKTNKLDLSVYAGKVDISKAKTNENESVKVISVKKGQAIKVEDVKVNGKNISKISEPVSIPKKVNWVE